MDRALPRKPWLLSRAQGWLQLVNHPASARFIWGALAVVWFTSLVLWRADYRYFPFICNHDSAAVLRTDEIISEGARPGTDFFYPYGLISLFIPHLFFAVFGRSPEALVALIGIFSCFSYVGLAWTLARFRPTRFGAVLLAGAAGHATWQCTPMYAMETAILIWAVALRLRGRSTAAIVAGTAALFVKMSMASVLLAELIGLTILDAVRVRRARGLVPLLAAPATFGFCAALSISWLDVPALVGSFNASAGAAMYRAYNFGFFREGRTLWDPRGHNVFWYLGGIPGPWCLASVALAFLGIRGGIRLVRSCLLRQERDLSAVCEEAATMSGFANLAYILGFYGPALNGAWYYAWLLLIGVAPSIARARLEIGGRTSRAGLVSSFGWLSLGLLLVLSESIAVRQFIGLVKQPRVKIGAVTITPDAADELTETLALGHSTGRGVITAVARAANFRLVDPSIREGHYWQVLKGIPPMRSIEELLRLARASDTLLVTTVDYSDLLHIPRLGALLRSSERLHEGKRFLLLRAHPQRERTRIAGQQGSGEWSSP